MSVQGKARKKHALVVDDEAGLRLMVRAVLEDAGWLVTEAESAGQALKILAEAAPEIPPDVMLLDMRMPGMDGMEALSAIRSLAPGLPVVMLTAYGTVGSAVEAMKKGAFDYLTKPVDNEELKTVLAKAHDYARLILENQNLRQQVREGREARDLVGQTPGMHKVRELIEQVGPSEATVLILGESGTGKELVASGLHRAGPRKHGPLVKVNCAALPGELLESELFGYAKGAFTGAARDKPGRFQLAKGGTLFLDEIGDMPLGLQAKLLRALQERVVEPLGSVKSVPTDVRILAASNKDLWAEVEAGRFREDLYFRLNVLEIRIPPLRERMEDLPLLAGHLLRALSEKNKKQVREVGPRFLEALSRYHWPGNVRELENVLERALVLSRSDSLDPGDLPPQILSPDQAQAGPLPESALAAPPQAPAPDSLDKAEEQAVINALRAHDGHRQKTAEALGVSRRTLQYKLRKYGLTRKK